MDKKLLKEHNLYEAHKKFNRLCEWSYVPTNLEEDDDNENEPNDDAPEESEGNGDAPMPNDNMPMPNDGMGQPEGGAPDMNGEQMPQAGGDNPEAVTGSMPEPSGEDMQIPDADMGDDTSDDDVIDVDDITNAQEKTNTKVNAVGNRLGDVDDKITTLLQSLKKMETMINNNNDEIQKFKSEFEKRNPTSTEKMQLRSLSYPFVQTPEKYWDNKNNDPNSNYEGIADNSNNMDSSFVIHQNEVSDYNDKEIEDSLSFIDDDLKQDLQKIFNF